MSSASTLVQVEHRSFALSLGRVTCTLQQLLSGVSLLQLGCLLEAAVVHHKQENTGEILLLLGSRLWFPAACQTSVWLLHGAGNRTQRCVHGMCRPVN